MWRIYRRDGELIDQFAQVDTLYWYEDAYSGSPIPELPDALREAFYLAGEKYARRISPYWVELSRQYYLISRDGEDTSLEKEKLIALKSGKNANVAFKACYNLAVLSESEDKLLEAIGWLDAADKFKQSETSNIYKQKLQKRLELREIIDNQSGYY